MEMGYKRPMLVTRLGQIDMIPSSVLVYDWEIRDFDRICPRNGSSFNTLVSKCFIAGEDVGKKSRWHAECKSEGNNLTIHFYLDEVLFMESPEGSSVSISTRFDMAIIRTSGADIVRFPIRHTFDSSARGGYNKALVSMATLWQNQSTHLEGNTLRLQIALEILGDKISNPKPLLVRTKDPAVVNGVPKLQADLEAMYNKEETSDTTVYCGEKTFFVHRVILTARSKVFAAMFLHDTKEAQNNRVDIYDFEPVVVDIVLRYIYNADLNALSATATGDMMENIIPFADKYGLTELKKFCFQQLLMKLNTERFGTFAVLVHLHGTDEHLNGFVKNYYETNWPLLMNNEDCRDCILKYPQAFFMEVGATGDANDGDIAKPTIL